MSSNIKIINEINKKFNLKKLRANQLIYFYQNKKNNKLEKIIIPIDSDINLIIKLGEIVDVEKNVLNKTIEKKSLRKFDAIISL